MDDIHSAAKHLHHITPTRDSPISKLDDDILLRIFELNGNMEDDEEQMFGKHATQNTSEAMKRTLKSSQVSARWRNLIVNSPLLWANLIDIQTLTYSGQNWRQEVLRRTKTCALHVKGVIDITAPENLHYPWWTRFLNDNWPRIRIFKVVLVARNVWGQKCSLATITPFIPSLSPKTQSAFRFLSRPTATLEHFTLKFPFPLELVKSPLSLFDGHAPRLRSLHIHNGSAHFRFMKEHDLFGKIDSLHLNEGSNSAFSSTQIFLDVISQLPRLRSLRIRDAIDLDHPDVLTGSAPGRDPIDLPFLTDIEFYSERSDDQRATWRANTPYWHILNTIIPKPGCSIKIMLFSDRSNDIDGASFWRYTENYFAVNSPDKLELMSCPKSFGLWNRRSINASTIPPMEEIPNLRISINSSPFLHPADRMVIFRATYSLSFPTVTNLRLKVSSVQHPAFRDVQFGKFLASFSSLEWLETTPGTLYSICTSPVVNMSTLFPQLKILEMPLEEEDRGVPSPINILTSFLKLRKKARVPLVKFIYQPNLKDDAVPMDLTFLDVFVGLTVQWPKPKEPQWARLYKCGSGKPERLNFKKKARF